MSQVAGTAERAVVRRSARRIPWNRALIVVALCVCTVIFIVPFLWMCITALKDNAELSAFPIHWLPANPEWGNFSTALTMIDYLGFARNTFLLSAIFAVLTTATSAMVGFGFARLKGYGKGPLFIVMLSTTMLPPILTTIPTYILFSRLGLIYNYWPWVLWGLGSSPFLSFLFRQFFAAIPLDLEDAAIIDGCGYVAIFWRIFLPVSKPILATAAIFSFQWVWGDWFTPNIFLSVDNTTLAVAMSNGYVDPQGFILTNVLSAGSIFYTLPVLVLFFFAQRYFVQGIVTTGLKG
jgi:ABC-type glycerol-3-phosphate transport system permease component